MLGKFCSFSIHAYCNWKVGLNSTLHYIFSVLDFRFFNLLNIFIFFLQPRVEGLHHKIHEFSSTKGRTPTLHEVMLAEKADFEAKVQQGQKRKKWLKGKKKLFSVYSDEKKPYHTGNCIVLLWTLSIKNLFIYCLIFFSFSANQTLLRTLLSYCSLRGANGGGLASVSSFLLYFPIRN